MFQTVYDRHANSLTQSQLVGESSTRRQVCRRPPATSLQLRQQHMFDTHDVDTHQRQWSVLTNYDVEG